jgi:galactokinase
MHREPFAVHAPGRVNLIGEHIDYCGLPVLPMAIQLGITAEVRPRAGTALSVSNRDSRFPPVDFNISTEIAPDARGHWGNYVRAAAQAIARRVGALEGADIAISSNLPVASGLSSSSALVVAIAVALLRRNGITLAPVELAALLAEGERYVGTAGGGMDQAIIVAAEAGMGTRIDFTPLRLRHVAIPATWCFIVAPSLERAEKSGAVQAAYNERTQATRAAHDHLVRRLRHEADFSALLVTHGAGELLDTATALDPVTYRRLRHVVTEATRVDQAIEAMEAADLESFGALMDASHQSLADDYEVSTPALDELVNIARNAGASGARLTGAGFGGSIVALAEASNAGRVLGALDSMFYRPRGVDTSPAFIAIPSAGAVSP